MDFLKQISESLHFFIKSNIADEWVLVTQIVSKFILLMLSVFVIDFFLKRIADIILNFAQKKFKKSFIKALIQSRVHHSFAHFVPLMLSQYFIQNIFFRHPQSYAFLEVVFGVLGIIILIILINRFLKSIEIYYIITNDQYKVTAFRAIYDTVKIVGYLIVGLIVISRIAGVSAAGVIGYLGAITAVVLLVFRDTILGFVTGVHVSTSKNLKVGDWIGVKKYDIEGVVQEINLLTTKIQNFDKTISTIPTYDLLSTEVRNHQVMYEGSTRRIKRSIYFNIKSFRFLDDELFERLQKINLISDYITYKYSRIQQAKSHLANKEEILNSETMTNIGAYRKYALAYLKNNIHIDQEERVMVRQLEISPQGMPLEIYCFSNKSEVEDYERIQADIFDHLLTAAKEFDLEVMQVSLN